MAGLFFVASLALRVPFRSEYAYHWDGAQFALAMEHYDIRESLPHPPGFFLYVQLGRLVNLLVCDPHASLVWISVVAGSVLSALGSLLATAMFGRRTGVVTGVILTTSLLTWFHSVVALTPIVDSALVTATALVCWRVWCHGGGWPTNVALAVLFAVVAGTRGQTAPALAPLWLCTLYRLQPRQWGRLAAVIGLTVLLTLFWFVPMVQSCGGLRSYWQLLTAKASFDATHSWQTRGARGLWNSVSMITGAVWVGLWLAGVLAAGQLLRLGRAGRAPVASREQWAFFGLWIVPMIAAGMGLYTFMPGHILNYFPALAIMAARAVTRLWEERTRSRRLVGAVVLGLIGVTNVHEFVFQPRWADRLLLSLPVTGAEVLRHDQQLRSWFAVIRGRYDPENVMICHAQQWFLWGFRQFQYHLPEFRNALLTPNRSLPGPLGEKMCVAQWRKTEFVDRLILPRRGTVVLVVPPLESLDAFRPYFRVSEATVLLDSDSGLYSLNAGVAW